MRIVLLGPGGMIGWKMVKKKDGSTMKIKESKTQIGIFLENWQSQKCKMLWENKCGFEEMAMKIDQNE